ncbi:MAG: class I SAM-dependent methyltransferase, partial [Bauldia litoralis]
MADEAAYRQKLQMTRECFRPDMSVLEFGCGTGTTAIAHAPYVRRIEAIDSAPRMIEIARQRAEAADVSNVAFAVGSIEALPTPARPFDAVLGLSILHLVADPDAVVAKVHRLLRPGGVFVSSTMCLGDTMKWIKYIDPLGR